MPGRSFLDFFSLAFRGLATPLAFRALAFALVFAFFSLALVFRAFRGVLGAAALAFFALGAVDATASAGGWPRLDRRDLGQRRGRSAAGACLAIMTSTDSDGLAPFRIHCSNLAASIVNFAGSVSGS